MGRTGIRQREDLGLKLQEHPLHCKRIPIAWMPGKLLHREFLTFGMREPEGLVQIRYKEDVFYSEGGKALAQIAQRNCGCPTPGTVQGQVGCSLDQLGLVENVPAHARGLKLSEL